MKAFLEVIEHSHTFITFMKDVNVDLSQSIHYMLLDIFNTNHITLEIAGLIASAIQSQKQANPKPCFSTDNCCFIICITILIL